MRAKLPTQFSGPFVHQTLVEIYPPCSLCNCLRTEPLESRIPPPPPRPLGACPCACAFGRWGAVQFCIAEQSWNLLEVGSAMQELPGNKQCNPGTSWKLTVQSSNFRHVNSVILEPLGNKQCNQVTSSKPTVQFWGPLQILVELTTASLASKSRVRNFPRQSQEYMRNKPGAKSRCRGLLDQSQARAPHTPPPPMDFSILIHLPSCAWVPHFWGAGVKTSLCTVGAVYGFRPRS